MLSNAHIAQALNDLATLMDLTGEDGFRVNAHLRAARAIEGLAEEWASNPTMKLEGVGPKLAEKITELCTTGRLAELEAYRAKVPPGLMDILKIPGLGPKTVKAMWEANITDIPALKKAIDDGSLLNLPRMGAKAVAKIKDAIAFAALSADRTHLGKAATIADTFVTTLSSIDGVSSVLPAGSLRRGKETIGDIDILVCIADSAPPSTAAAVTHAFCSIPGALHTLARGESKSSIRFSLDPSLGRWQPKPDPEAQPEAQPDAPTPAGPSIQVDLRILPQSRFGSALMYFTGSKEHNVKMRERAITMGCTLNEWGLFRQDPSDKNAKPPQERGLAPIASASEEDVFRALGLPWIPPEVREDRGELAHQDPWRLVELSDIKAELHAHTTASDGVLSILELAAEAKRRGFHTIAVTDHSQSSTIAGGLRPDRLRLHIQAIREANAQIDGIRILAGSEVDILADGSLDYSDELLAQLDIVVASPHAALSQDPATATQRLLKAIQHPLVHILGHPTGRLILRRPGNSPDMPTLFAAAKQHNVALEVNSHWMRLDLRDTHVKAAQDLGCLISINCDDHERSDFDNLRFGIQTARRGWLQPYQCINTWPAGKLHTWLKAKRP
ncbi:MAG: PHP domain-containing protein [Planctomycetota bacterium]|nr:PHP domain-containing protein [Planctomycetota bacterium]